MMKDKLIGKCSDKFRAVELPLISEESKKSNDFFAKDSRFFEKKDGDVYLLHAGTFYSDIRNPKKLVDFMTKLPPKYKLIVAGINSSDIHEYDSGIRDRVIDLGCLKKTDIDYLVEICDFLISYNNLNNNMLPSKLFECIDSCKPFINLCHTASCPSIEYINGYELAFNVILNERIDVDRLINFMEMNKGRKSTREQILAR